MTWRRLLFLLVYLIAWIPLMVMFVIGYSAEWMQQQIERMDQWSRDEE